MNNQQLDNVRVLAIDDDVNILEYYRTSLTQTSSVGDSFERLLFETVASDDDSRESKQFFDLTETSQGEDGVALAAKAKEEGRPFACALVDMRMPPGIDGHETARRLRALDEQIFIIIVTAYSDTEIGSLQQAVRHDLLYSSKPIPPDQLHQLVYNACISWDRTNTLHQLQEELENKVRARTEEIERLSEQAQFSAFQAGLVEMNSSVIHNIGNAVGGMGGLSWKLESELKGIQTISKGLEQLQQECHQLEQGGDLPENMAEQIKRRSNIMKVACDSLNVIAEKRLKGIVDTLSESVDYIKGIVTLQQAAAKSDSHATAFRLDQLVDDALIILQDRFDQYAIEVHKSFELEPEELHLPRNQLLQLLINIMKNSLEAVMLQQEQAASPDYCGEVNIELRQHHTADRGYVQLRVIDSGVGSSLPQQEKLFASGFSTKKRSSGLGLHSAANFIQSIGGEIHFYSAGDGEGATVDVQIPLK